MIVTTRTTDQMTVPQRKPVPRRGVVMLELILALPLLIIVVMAIVEFGLLFSNEQVVAMASRAGTQVASELTTIPSAGAVPVTVETAVARELARIGVTRYRIRLEHNADFTPPPLTMTAVVLTTTSAGGPTGGAAPSAITLTPDRRYVRVTVYVWTTDLTPNLLSTFCVDLSNRVSSQTTLRRHVG